MGAHLNCESVKVLRSDELLLDQQEPFRILVWCTRIIRYKVREREATTYTHAISRPTDIRWKHQRGKPPHLRELALASDSVTSPPGYDWAGPQPAH
eukprot:5868909-Pyramimonas_sp.AAC.1